MRYRDLRGVLASSVAVMAVAVATPAMAQVRSFNIPAQAAATGIPALAKQADIQLLVSSESIAGKNIRAVKGRMTVDEALRRMASDVDLRVVTTDGRTYTLTPREKKGAQSSLQAPVYQAAQAPQYDSDIIVVTAQKKEERITDVPIAMSALSAQALDDYKIEGGSELLRAIPNVNFSKNNFSMYNFSIRGVGTKATSASSDPAVAISFNNTPLVKNRLFEAEFFDMQRIEVLRGPQGTLYGRNATGGVVNMITAQPTDNFGGEIKGETGNYNTRRLSGMLNLPATDTFGVRIAGAMTKRDGYDLNTWTGKRVNGRDLWSTRVTAAWEPSDRFKANFIWQHFEEDDNRSRTGKNLCKRDPGPERIGNVDISGDLRLRGRLSQGCLPASLYDDESYGAPNGYALTYVMVPSDIQIGNIIDGGIKAIRLLNQADTYAGVTQSRNLREIETSYDPIFRANNDIFQFNVEFSVAENIKIVSQTAYSTDEYYSTQDYNRFVSTSLFNASDIEGIRGVNFVLINTDDFPGPTPGGFFFDPQLGWQDRMVSADLSKTKSKQWYQEFRLQSDFDGPLNFNIGANYLNYKSKDDYYVFNNMFTIIAQYYYGSIHPVYGTRMPPHCPLGYEGTECIYVDPNPLASVDDQGHNYFLSQNPVKTESKAVFGEIYFNATDNLKITLGGRYTDDKKISRQIPSQLMLGGGVDNSNKAAIGRNTGGNVNSGYPELDSIKQNWEEITGRFVVDWKPDLSFTDDTLIYFSAAHGYKGGGTNPPRVDLNPALVQYLPLPQTFEPEKLNALEVGFKNSFSGGRFSLNATGFFYDYKNYQISQISDRIAFNENFDAITWGLELEAVWRPSPNFRFDTSLGYLRTKIGKGEGSIDPMNRTQGDEDWVVLRPWLQAPSNCIAPRAMVEAIVGSSKASQQKQLALMALCPGSNRLGDFNPATSAITGVDYHLNSALGYNFTYNPSAPYDPTKVGLLIPYDPANPDAWIGQTSGAPNAGRGFTADLSGNELPNAPRLTFNVGGEYRTLIDQSRWELSLRGDYYRQSKSWWRVYNHPSFDRIKGWDNVNASITLRNLQYDFAMQLYVKNIFDNDSITDAFLNADDTGLATNVFTVDPRIIGFSISKSF